MVCYCWRGRLIYPHDMVSLLGCDGAIFDGLIGSSGLLVDNIVAAQLGHREKAPKITMDRSTSECDTNGYFLFSVSPTVSDCEIRCGPSVYVLSLPSNILSSIGRDLWRSSCKLYHLRICVTLGLSAYGEDSRTVGAGLLSKYHSFGLTLLPAFTS